jgi:quercetin dioxygenase-like cupin family protein
MHVVAQKDLPFRGMSHEFVGADHGPVAVSAYLVEAPPGRRARLHRHPYDEVAFVRE